MNIYEAIKKDHAVQRDLLTKILATSGASEERKALWLELRKELEVHEVTEERHFYKPLIQTDKMQEDARHGMAEHHEIDELIQELEKTDMDSPHWLATMKTLDHKVRHHLADEEKEFFGKAKKVYSPDEAEELADNYDETKEDYKKEWPGDIPGSELKP